MASSGAGSSSTVDDEDRSAAEEEVDPKSFRKSRKSTIKSSEPGEELTEEEDYEEGNASLWLSLISLRASGNLLQKNENAPQLCGWVFI